LAAPEREGKETKEISRGHTITVSLAGLVSIIGGKWTTYRKIGEDAVNKAMLMGELKERPSVSSQMPLHGFMMGADENDHLRWYGSDALKIRSIVDKDPSLGEKIIASYPYIKAQRVWAVSDEMARTIEDFLARRIRLLFTDANAAIEAAPVVAKIMAAQLGEKRKWQKQQVEEFNKLAQGYLLKKIK
jgi:glycerol-3-phosphate dehydrogenase